MPHGGGWILERSIDGFPCHDAMGCYPIFACQNWLSLNEDLERMGSELVSLSMVTDPFGAYDEPYLRRCFPDVVIPFKQHFVVDLSRPPDTFVHPHHRRNARRALGEMQVEKCVNPENFLEEWTTLYSTLLERHNFTGIAAFSLESFARQLRVPGMVAFRAVRDGVTLGMVLWYAYENRSYYHLGAYTPVGYELRASFALFTYSLEYFAEHGIRWLNLGAGAGLDTNAKSGLTRFKQGWSTGTRTAYFCGRIFDRKKYQEIVFTKNVPATEYFPAYRAGEFA